MDFTPFPGAKQFEWQEWDQVSLCTLIEIQSHLTVSDSALVSSDFLKVMAVLRVVVTIPDETETP
jgi:hypothetical protein